MPVARKATTRAFCDRVWDSLFSSIVGCKALTREQRRVYEYLWRHVDVRTRIYEMPLGQSATARRLGLSDSALARVLEALCAKGFTHRLAPLARRPLRFGLNPLIIESAYEQTKRMYPDLLAS
jgi:DNA-binding MarR family transcriptional regulator